MVEATVARGVQHLELLNCSVVASAGVAWDAACLGELFVQKHLAVAKSPRPASFLQGLQEGADSSLRTAKLRKAIGFHSSDIRPRITSHLQQ